jgi:hypothetical protein
MPAIVGLVRGAQALRRAVSPAEGASHGLQVVEGRGEEASAGRKRAWMRVGASLTLQSTV